MKRPLARGEARARGPGRLHKRFVEAADAVERGAVHAKIARTRIRKDVEERRSSARKTTASRVRYPGFIEAVEFGRTGDIVMFFEGFGHRAQPIVADDIVGIAENDPRTGAGSYPHISRVTSTASIEGIDYSNTQPVAEGRRYLRSVIRRVVVDDYNFPRRVARLFG